MSVPEFAIVLGEMGAALQSVDAAPLADLERRIGAARRVYVAGAGRSGLVMRGFAMRLMHLGLQVHVVGDVTTPAIAAGDLLVVGSGSGETESLAAMARKARTLGAGLALVTIVPGSTIGRLAEVVLRLDAPSPKASPPPGAAPRASVQPMGSLFEQALLVLVDTIVLRLARTRGATYEEMFGRHANLE
ncbi:MAG TPA: 6-phospho-3-hexuloisomerase [Anaeromyxobacter sp.]|nr:6-phospho-3-hexuloisomerase [Anaeromyxobacter sp.]